MSTKKKTIKGRECVITVQENSHAASLKATVESARNTPVTMEGRSGKDRRNSLDRRQKSIPVGVERRQGERRAKVNRRRQIDPTTCERDYSGDEIEFMNAMDNYKRRSGRMFPTCSEILEVIRALGYEKRPVASPLVTLPELPSQPVSPNLVL